MQPRAEEIHRVLATFVKAKRAGEADSRRRAFGLVVQGSTPLLAEVRELRATCAMIDIGSSIYTLAFSDILGIDPVPAGEGGLRITVRPGCFASHVAARLRRAAPRSWSTAPAVRRPTVAQSEPYDSYVREAEPHEQPAAKTNGGTAEGDPAGSESAGHELVVNDAVRTRRR
ncbi:MAG: hypothetical protein WD314_04330 [Trueperaceae bacterium]